ncbi:LysM peptidoglycan-binding domain-containing protein [bacterium]|nr:LysM peptidoglycan-binding domain-containing protein [candidate division CSSED10-310 bacterium]
MRIYKMANAIIILGLVTLLAVSTIGFAQEKTWTYGGIEYRLPKPLEEIQIPAELPEYHVVVPGDCLWFIARHYLNDPFLWPLIWEENLDTIENPHLIFPDQHVKLPGGIVVATGQEPGAEGQEGMAGEEDEEGGEYVADTGFEGMEIKPPEPFPVTSRTAIISSGYIATDKIKAPKIIGANTESYDLSTNDIVYIDTGSPEGMEPDTDMFVVRKLHKVHHPVSGKYLGWMVHVMAEIKTLCVNEDMTSAVIGETFHPVVIGDLVIPKADIPIPVTLGSPPTDPCNPSTRQLPGTIVDAYHGGPMFSDAVIIARGDIAYVDLGTEDGVAPGDYFTIFKRNFGDQGLPRYVSGEAMVVKVAETTSTVVITQSQTAIFIGDQIELKQ